MQDAGREADRLEQMELTGQRAWVEGKIWSVGETAYGWEAELSDCRVFRKKTGEEPFLLSGRVLVYLESGTFAKEDLYLGRRLRAFGELQAYEPARNPGGFDGLMYARSKKRQMRLYADRLEFADENMAWFREGLRRVRGYWGEILLDIGGEADGGVYQAALLGDKSQLSEEILSLYQRNGIAHLLAISGLHMSLIGMAVYGLSRRLGAGFGAAMAVGGLLIGLYTVLVGASPSVVRASVMLLCAFGAAALGRTYDLLSALSLSALCILWDNPWQLFQAGFQLSFGAVLGIGCLVGPGESFFLGTGANGPAAVWKKGLYASACIQLATMPVTLYHFFQTSVYGIFLNIIVIPLMGYVAASGIAGLFFGMVWRPAGVFFAGTGHYVLLLYEALCQIADRLPGSVWVSGRPSALQMGLYVLALFGIWTGLCRGWIRRRMTAAAGLFAALLLLTLSPVRGMEITFLDVGQGDGICIRTKDAVMLVDGGSSDEKAMGERMLEPFLKSRGISCIDYAWVSHGDADHMNGLLWLLRESRDIQVERLLLPAAGKGDEAYEELCRLTEEKGGQVYWVGAGDVLSGEGWRLSCLAPGAEASAYGTSAYDRNEQSLVLRLEYGRFSMVLTGDIGEETEKRLVKDSETAAALSDATVLKIAHHGSGYSSCTEWLQAVSPMWGVVSYGRDNSYGHPHKETLERLDASRICLWETAKSGAVTLWTDGEEIFWESQLPGACSLWYDRRKTEE